MNNQCIANDGQQVRVLNYFEQYLGSVLETQARRQAEMRAKDKHASADNRRVAGNLDAVGVFVVGLTTAMGPGDKQRI